MGMSKTEATSKTLDHRKCSESLLLADVIWKMQDLIAEGAEA